MKVLKKVPKHVCFSAQNVLDPLLSLHMYLFIPKVFLKDQKMLNLRIIKKNIKEDLPTTVLLLLLLSYLNDLNIDELIDMFRWIST